MSEVSEIHFSYGSDAYACPNVRPTYKVGH